MLSEINTALESTGKRVFYGQAGNLDGEDIWDYIVFFRDTLAPSQNKTGFAESYQVAIVQEDFIEDATVWQVIDAMTALPGMRVSDSAQFNYTVKPNTENVLEILTLRFVRPVKRC